MNLYRRIILQVYNNLYKDEVTQQRGWLLSSFLLTVSLIDKTDFEIFFLTYAKNFIFFKSFFTGIYKHYKCLYASKSFTHDFSIIVEILNA